MAGLFPGMGQIAEIGQAVRGFVQFGQAALTTIIQNQHALASRLANIERNLGIAEETALLAVPQTAAEIDDGIGGN